MPLDVIEFFASRIARIAMLHSSQGPDRIILTLDDTKYNKRDELYMSQVR